MRRVYCGQLVVCGLAYSVYAPPEMNIGDVWRECVTVYGDNSEVMIADERVRLYSAPEEVPDEYPNPDED